MKIIISPAKKMKTSSSSIKTTKPCFYEDAFVMANFLKSLSPESLQKSFKIKGKLLDETLSTIGDFSNNSPTFPAIFTYDGIQYKYMDALSMKNDELNFLNDKLRILSGLYGVLKPFDGISFYRLEMQAEFKGEKIPSVYSFWANKIYLNIFEDNDIVLNLASLEYSKTLKTYLTPSNKLIDVYFYQRENGKLVEKGVYAKMLRGLMVKYIATNKINDVTKLKDFNELNYKFNKEESNSTKLVFIKEEN